jgi:hypothetical protein
MTPKVVTNKNKMAEYIKASSFRNIQKSPFVVKKVYPKYQSGGIMMGDKFVGRTFVYNEEKKLQEKKWDDNERKFILADFDDIKVDREFYATYKKVFDVEVECEKEVELEEKRKGEQVKVKGTSFVIKGLGAFKLREMLKEDFDLIVEEDSEGRRPFDWEDELVNTLEGSKYQMKVTGKMLETSYKFKLLEKAEKMEDVGFVEEEKPSAGDLLPF